MARLRPEPELYDVPGWRALVSELRAAPPAEAAPAYLAYAEAHLSAIAELPRKTPAQQP
ncbi:hypothetical protein [Pseudotabrizicola algicola]|uniref:Uncharacterized protein n=1 Tax=Pseudotabrizicola algicola TaxID=2709381 RepID=A0A6B3RNH9_9RHOB|nr:hypothetical protein [Pseudotabrizicola algicola]NEX47610.1 hypothetical protein [Pseudotabrizicola algicola]